MQTSHPQLQLQYFTFKAALGKLSRAQIEKGQAVLAQLRVALTSGGKPSASTLAQLSGQYYSLIPTTSGRVAPPPLNNEEALTEKEGLLEFWLRMGFEDVQATEQLGSPIEGVRELPLPKTLSAAASNVSDSGSIGSSRTRGEEEDELVLLVIDYEGPSPLTPLNHHLYHPPPPPQPT